MRFLFIVGAIVTTIIDNMFNRRWWFLWFFQVVFSLILLERIFLEPKNEFLYALMIGWTTGIVIVINVEACYADYMRSVVKKFSTLVMSKSVSDGSNADQ